ncbi:LuxR family transcriptional regulator [Streptomyces sanyensis]|uniref:LuxR family transcriptional regulator n=1 Tax=Streptomyces sanyensis TaxID=568869 RepID=A0ABP9ASY2_9ACTN
MRQGNLPAEATSFVGRRRETTLAREMLSRNRLLTLTGPGGIGKTRLALRLADQVKRSFPDGVWLVELAATKDEEAVVQTVLSALGRHDDGGRPPMTVLADHVRRRQLLLVLDNCEHVLLPCAALARSLLQAAPGLRVIATSRQSLGVSGEGVVPVPALEAPDPREGHPGRSSGEAVQLFMERAAAALGDPAATAVDAHTAALICHRLEGIPLAIEMAAARLRVLSGEQILQRLDDRFALLTGGCRGGLPRQRTLQATMDWSFELCTPTEQLLWARMSVFPGTFDLDAVEAVCAFGALAPWDALDVLTGLADKSVVLREDHHPCARYRMLDTVRHYGLLRLGESHDEQPLRRRHRDHFHNVVLRARQDWFSPRQTEWTERLHRERPNLRTAMNFCFSTRGEAQAGLEMAAALWSHRLGAGSLSEERRWLERALASTAVPNQARARALWADGWLALLCGDPDAARIRVAECCAQAAQLKDPLTAAQAAQLEGLAALFADEFSQALPALEGALDRFGPCGDLGDVWSTVFLLGLACCLQGDPRAADLSAQCLALCEEHGAQWSRPYALWLLGLHHWLRRETGHAIRLLRDGLRTISPAHNRLAMAQCLEVLAWAHSHDGHHARAAELLGAAHSAWQLVGATLPGVGRLLHHRTACEELLVSRLGENRFTALHRTGAALETAQALALALDLQEAPAAGDPQPPPLAQALTLREREVAELLAEGLTDREIAARLVISSRTAEGHVQRILRKLGCTSRVQVATWLCR